MEILTNLPFAVVTCAVHEQVVTSRIELKRRSARADNLVAVKVSDEPGRYRLATILRIDMTFDSVAAVMGDACAPRLCPVEHVLDGVEALGTRLENKLQSKIIVGAQRYLRLCGSFAFEQSADDEVVGTRLQCDVLSVGLRAVHIYFVCLQTADK